MSGSRKVFIYNGTCVGPKSLADLKALFEANKSIFPNGSDVTLSPKFDIPMDGLSDPVFVVPGGSTSVIGNVLMPNMKKIKLHFKENFSYVGVCAGAFLGVKDAELYMTKHPVNKTSALFEAVTGDRTTKEMNIAFNLIDDYRAFGAFYPNDTHLYVPTTKGHVPYSVTLSLTNTTEQISQLYVAGPALISDNDDDIKSSSEVIATYVGHENFRLFSKHYQPDEPLAAIVRRRSEPEKGGILLAATHIEACVGKSQLFSLFNDNTANNNNTLLSKQDRDCLVKEREETKIKIESLLKDTLTIRNG